MFNDCMERVTMILRLHIFNLLQTVSLHTMKLDIGVPSRGWHEKTYSGHVFCDELFIFLLLNLRCPELLSVICLQRGLEPVKLFCQNGDSKIKGSQTMT